MQPQPEHIKEVLAAIPAEHIGQTRFVTSYFYGQQAKLKKLRSRIKLENEDASFELGDGELVVTRPVEISQCSLDRMAAAHAALARDVGLEYDGFAVNLEQEQETEIQQKFEPFEQHVPIGSAFAFPLSDKRFGHAIFLAGDSKNGYVFDFTKLVTDQPAAAEEVFAAPRLYRQPIMGSFDPLTVSPLGKSKTADLPRSISFRLEMGHPSPEEMDQIARSFGLNGLTDDMCMWWELLERMKQAGQRLPRDGATHYVMNIDTKGRATWHEGGEINPNDIMLGIAPMPFGLIARLDDIDRTLLGGIDTIDLMDKT
jgi:hypothetical protein